MDKKEWELFSEKLADIQCNAVEKVINLADDFKMDRDKAVETFASSLVEIAMYVGFKYYIPGNKE